MLSRVMLVGLMWLPTYVCAMASDSDRVVHLDATKGNPGKHEIAYLTMPGQEKSPDKIVAVILSRSDEQDLVYVYRKSDGSADLGILADAEFDALQLDSAELSKTTVRVTKAQYKRAKKIIKTHVEISADADSPEIRFYNCICEVLRACTMKIPYRSPYRPPNPTQWVGDIPAYSRDLVVEN